LDHVPWLALDVELALVQRDALPLRRYPAFAIQVHRVEHLRLHFAVGEAAAQPDEPVSEGRFAVVNVRDDGKVTYVPHEPPGCCRVLPRLEPCGRRIIGKFGPLSSAPASGARVSAGAQQPLELAAIEALTTDHRAIE